jgi:hypothetical protein
MTEGSTRFGGQGGDRLTSSGFGIDPNATGIRFEDHPDAGMTAARLRSSGSGWPVSPCAVACAELPDDYSESDCRNAPTA